MDHDNPGWTARDVERFLKLPLALLGAREAALRRIRLYLRDRRLTEPQWRVLRALQTAAGPLAQADLARATGLSLHHVRGPVDRLVARRLAAWTAPMKGARSRRPRAVLTARGFAAIAEVQAELRRRWRDLECHFGSDERAELEALLARLAEALAGAAPERRA